MHLSKHLIRTFLVVSFFALVLPAYSQPAGYYNGTEGLSGDNLKQALHNIIKDHVDFSYSYSRSIMDYTDQDPDNPDNVILFYLQESRNADEYGSGGDYINREHVWAKSHGDFSGIRPMDSDVHNLHPADASVNEDRSNKDFDNIQPLGSQHSEALYCYYTDSTWEPGPLTKGQVARTLFYMATRYEGDGSESDLELVNHNNTSPNPLHGNLDALLEWNREYPPSEFEKRRNERLYRIQQNRNPFVDHPEFADFIWASQTPSGPEFAELEMSPEIPTIGEAISLSLTVSSSETLGDLILYWGAEDGSTANQQTMAASGSNYSATFTPSGFSDGDMLYYTVATTLGDSTYTFASSYLYPETINQDAITTIPDVQGTGQTSPLSGQQVTIAGRITANFDYTFYMQTADSEYGGMNIYNSLFRGQVGDSIVVTGTVAEYNGLTEITDVSYNYNYKANTSIDPSSLTTAELAEKYEGMLVTINNVTFADGGSTITDASKSYTISDNAGQSVVYVSSNSRLSGYTIPTSSVNITGVLSEYNGTYQLLPRDVNDFQLATASNDITLALQKAIVYPNPVSNQLYIDSSEEIAEISIFNLAGQKLIHRVSPGNSISTDFLKAGIYLVEIEYANQAVQQEKLIKIDN